MRYADCFWASRAICSWKELCLTLNISEEWERFSEAIMRQGVDAETFGILTRALDQLGPEEFARRISDTFTKPHGIPARSLRLRDHLTENTVLTGIESEDWSNLLGAMLAPVVDLIPPSSFDSARDALVEGGKATGWFPGGGIALPHVTVPKLDHTLLVVGRLKNGLAVSSSDGEPVRLVFLLLDSPGDTERHLLLLAHVAAVCGPTENRGLLLAAADSKALRDAILALDYDPFHMETR